MIAEASAASFFAASSYRSVAADTMLFSGAMVPGTLTATAGGGAAARHASVCALSWHGPEVVRGATRTQKQCTRPCRIARTPADTCPDAPAVGARRLHGPHDRLARHANGAEALDARARGAARLGLHAGCLLGCLDGRLLLRSAGTIVPGGGHAGSRRRGAARAHSRQVPERGPPGDHRAAREESVRGHGGQQGDCERRPCEQAGHGCCGRWGGSRAYPRLRPAISPRCTAQIFRRFSDTYPSSRGDASRHHGE